MKYRVELDISFNVEDDAISFLNLIEKIKGKVYKGIKAAPAIYGEDVAHVVTQNDRDAGDDYSEYTVGEEIMIQGELITPAVTGDGISAIHNCRYHKCFHDDNPPKKCGDYVNIDITDGVPIEHKNSYDEVVKVDIIIPEDVKTEIKMLK